jgi:cation transport ATPase
MRAIVGLAALAAAGIGVAMGSGTDVALETSDAAILKSRVVMSPPWFGWRGRS